ncbi:hypothetical protein GOODEAATRI_027435 [Goodea atripinnis]|uniref:Acylphosphatase-like domain-containing protein n=1 Tax=Goodea atripinnis TaxID=208336 RepID=A0ABV0P882_9TELE
MDLIWSQKHRLAKEKMFMLLLVKMCLLGSKSKCLPVLQYTEKEGLRLGLVGWVKNTSRGTVVGQVQGPADMVEEM